MTLRKTMLSAAAVTTGILLSMQAATAEVTNASVTIVTSPSITKNADLNFGEVIPSSGGNVIMGPGGVRSVSGGGVVLGTAPGNAAEFTIVGGIGASYTVTMSPDATLTGPGPDMFVTGFTSDATGVLTVGTETFGVGGDLYINPSQPAGVYSGSFDVNVNYN